MKIVSLWLLLICFEESYSQQNQHWFAFKPGTNKTTSVINMSQWLDKPAGKHGFLQYEGKDFVFEDGTKTKFWGVNIASNSPFVKEDEAIRWTNFMAGYGINAVRFHKFTWEATDGIHSTQLTNAKWKNFDFFCNELRNAGIYYSWSHIYGHRLLPADSARVLAYREIADTKFPWSHLNGSTAGIVNFAEDLQALNIELTVNMLNHINPLTGLRYADDPALNFIELQNEDNIFWSAIEETLKQTPTYKKLLCRQFSDWLRKKYGTQENLIAAWKQQGLPAGETLEQNNIYPKPNHGYFSYETEQAQKNGIPLPMHVADRVTFLYEAQLHFYQRFVAAIRATGYKGVIVGSCWQAGSGIAHFYNLFADYNAGAIDRHNYSGGGTGHQLTTGNVDNEAMVAMPGSGLLSTGFQQVADRPFQISEWMALIPNQWTAESSPIIAAYGMGLQGWDASYAFAMDYDHFTPTIQSHGVYNVTSPTQLALYPALASMIYNNDIKESETILNRNIDTNDLKQGRVNITDKTTQHADVKRFNAQVPAQLLAVGKTTLSFNDPASEKRMDNYERFIDTVGKVITSVTGQLVWNYSGKGCFSINAPGTKGIVGFMDSGIYQLGEISLQTTNDFAVILLTSLQQETPLATAKKILLTVMARAENTGMQYNEAHTELLKLGTAPILLEPVEVTLNIKRKKGKSPTVYVLDHSGNRTGETIAVTKNSVYIDSKKYKTMYYEIEFEK